MTEPVAIRLLRSAVFVAAAIPSCWYAARRGGAPERVTAALIVLAIIATTVITDHNYRHVVAPLVLVDAAMLTGLVAVALAADRYWPLYVAAIQLLTVALHGVRAYDPTILPDVYARLGGELAYPILIMLVLGTRRHVQRGKEPDWVWQVRHDPSIDPGDQC